MTTKTPNVIDEIQAALLSDDENDSARLLSTYHAADDATKAVIDDVLITVCGYSLGSLIKRAEANGNYLAD